MARATPPSDGFPLAVLVEGGLALAAAFFAWLLGISLRDQFPSTGQSLAAAVARGVFVALPMLVLFWMLVRSHQQSLRELQQQVRSLVREMFPSGSFAQFALVAVLAGVGEELLFRGVVQTKLSQWTTSAMGLVLASLIFGAAHALSKIYFLLATVIGLYLGWFAQHYGELVTPIVAHALYDFLALVYLSRSGPRGRRRIPSDAKGEDDDRTIPNEPL